MRDKRKKFVEIAEKRINRLIKDIRLVGNLSNKANYTYSDDDIRKIFTAIDNEVRLVRKRFESSGIAEESVFKL